jgi:hypothetical protein
MTRKERSRTVNLTRHVGMLRLAILQLVPGGGSPVAPGVVATVGRRPARVAIVDQSADHHGGVARKSRFPWRPWPPSAVA